MTVVLPALETMLDEIFARALRTQPQIDHIVIASEQGLVVAYKSRSKGKELRLAALAPVLTDAGEAVFNECGLAPLGEIMLFGPEGTTFQVRLKSHPAFLLLSAKGQVNVGLLRMIANQIEADASHILENMLA